MSPNLIFPAEIAASTLFAAMIGLVVYQIFSYPHPITNSESVKLVDVRAAKPDRRKATADSSQLLMGSSIMRFGVKQLRIITCLALAGFTYLVSQNLIASVAFGVIGFTIPDTIVKEMAWDKWTDLDRSAYAAVYSFSFYLAQGITVLDAWQMILPTTQKVFRNWMEPCLLRESAGIPLEATMKKQADDVGHVELSVLADVISAERAHGGTESIIKQLLSLWGVRIELDSERRGTMFGFLWVGRIVMVAAAAMFWYMVVFNAAVRLHSHTLAGQIVVGIGAVFIALSVMLYNKQSKMFQMF